MDNDRNPEPAPQGACGGLAPDSSLSTVLPPRLWLAAWAIAFLPALAYTISGDFPLSHDSTEYLRLGRAIAETGTYAENGQPVAYWPPGMPYIVSLMLGFVGDTWAHFATTNLVLHGLLLAAVGRFAHLIGGARIGVCSMVLWGFLWDSFRQPPLLMSELPYTLMLLASTLLFFDPLFRRHPIAWLCGGLLLGLGILVRTTAMLLLPFAMGFVLLSPWHQWQQKGRALLLLAVALAALAVPVSLWTYRNYQIYAFVFPISLNSGDNLGLSNNRFGTIAYIAPDHPYRLAIGIAPGDPVAVHKAGNAEFRRTWAQDPVGSLMRCFPRLGITMFRHYPWFGNPGILQNPWYEIYEWMITIQWQLYLFLIVAGMLFTTGSRSPLEWAILILALYWLGMHSMILGDPRYRIPLVPFVLPYAAHFIVRVLPRLPQLTRAIPRA